ncbi:antitoxin [Puniceicoccales bacterium CK1056]|uniref:Antitoxin n=1 Tax=Oceanipulchritudo coccoides TaxID=2706888 RepID=A0A6B2M534_9BACT|nr:antitoxin [Oceanipulchritudo coccoides]NDV62760.1 antitoxin [Oceanipulchritudo coccoides]
MRTTLTLDPDVEQYIREACHKRKASFKRVVNDALRASLKPVTGPEPTLLKPRSMGLAPGIDHRRLSELADELELEAHLAAEDPKAYNRGKS